MNLHGDPIASSEWLFLGVGCRDPFSEAPQWTSVITLELVPKIKTLAHDFRRYHGH